MNPQQRSSYRAIPAAIVFTLLAGTLVLLHAGSKLIAADAPKTKPVIFSTDEFRGLLQGEETLDELTADVRRLQQAPLYLRISYLNESATYLADPTACKTPELQPVTQNHNLNCIGGRAAWVIEQVTGASLPPNNPANDPNRPLDGHEVAKAAVVAYRSGAINAIRESRTTQTIEALQKRYGKKVTTEIGDNANASAEIMREFLNEWFPIGEPIEEMAQILGVAGKKTREGFKYDFDTGYSGSIYEFTVTKGVITGVFVTGIE